MAASAHKGELEIPPAARDDIDAIEIVRIWAAGGAQQVSLRTGIWEDAAVWGIMLVDLAKHVANAHLQTNGTPRSQTLARIRQGFDAEWESATDDPTGRIL